MVEDREDIPVEETPEEPAPEAASPPAGKETRRGDKPAFSPGILFAEGMKLGFRNFFTFLVLAVLCHLPVFVTGVWASEKTFMANLTARIQAVPLDPGAALGPSMVNLFLSVLVGWFTMAVLVFTAVRTLSGNYPSFGEAISKGFSRFPAVFWVSILASLFTFVGFLVFIIPGIIVSLMLYLSLPVTVLEKKGGMEALKRSARLTSGYKGDIFVGLLPLSILFGIANYTWGRVGGSILTGLFGNPRTLEAWKLLVAGVSVVTTLLAVIFSLFLAAFSSFAYVRLKEIKEGVNLQELVEVFR